MYLRECYIGSSQSLKFSFTYIHVCIRTYCFLNSLLVCFLTCFVIFIFIFFLRYFLSLLCFNCSLVPCVLVCFLIPCFIVFLCCFLPCFSLISWFLAVFTFLLDFLDSCCIYSLFTFLLFHCFTLISWFLAVLTRCLLSYCFLV
ncbi:unnamed protein product [Brassica oleracea var. botrytis]|uniref:(rape) hypothetical protein n=1 Tax=Brassica napus TaxID=3708 RepID=A0A816IYH0_BRANA|nr:unnamed protein product [Brassica napus]